jgi:hypothetical protein
MALIQIRVRSRSSRRHPPIQRSAIAFMGISLGAIKQVSREEVACQDRLSLGAQELRPGKPGSARCGVDSGLHHTGGLRSAASLFQRCSRPATLWPRAAFVSMRSPLPCPVDFRCGCSARGRQCQDR